MNPSLEYGIIGDFMTFRPEEMYDLVKLHGLKKEHFKDNDARRAFEKIMEMKCLDKTLIAGAVNALIGEKSAAKAIDNSNANHDILEIEARIRNVVESAKLDNIAAICNQELQKGSLGDMTAASRLSGLIQQLQALGYTDGPIGSAIDDMHSLSELKDADPEETRRTELFEHGFFRKGQTLFLTSVSGAGKSVLMTQFCYAWAVGEAMFGIKPVKPLKIGIFQTEDDDEDMRLFRNSMRFNFKAYYNWDDEKIKAAEANIFTNNTTVAGDEFVAFLREKQAKYNFDLVVINPLQGVTDFDISDNTKIGEFGRHKIDDIIKDKNKPCGLMIVHHTVKPGGKDKDLFGRDAYAQYVGAGGQNINAWMRGCLLIMPTKERGIYNLIAAKRGDRLLKVWKERPGNKIPHPNIMIRHSNDGENYPFWLEFDPEAERQAKEEAKKAEKAESDAEIMERCCRELADHITRELKGTELRALAKTLFSKTRGAEVYNHFILDPHKYGIIYRKVGTTGKIYGTRKMMVLE